MVFNPITEENKEQWIAWLEEQREFLDGLEQEEITRDIFNTEEGDLRNVKDMVGNFLATLKNQVVTIN